MGGQQQETTSEISDTTRVSLSLVIGICGGLLVLAGVWFGMEAKVEAIGFRVSGLESRLDHLERASCSIEKKVGVNDPDCEERH